VTPWIQVVFGKVLEGMDIVKMIGMSLRLLVNMPRLMLVQRMSRKVAMTGLAMMLSLLTVVKYVKCFIRLRQLIAFPVLMYSFLLALKSMQMGTRYLSTLSSSQLICHVKFVTRIKCNLLL